MSSPEAGLAAERTALAWRRTAIAAMANAVLFLKVTYSSDWPPMAVLALLAAIGLVVVSVVCVARSRILHSHNRGNWDSGRRGITAVAVAVTGVAGVAVVYALYYAVELS
ncbi:DUF202 domain-containing protein [Nocardia sp. NPDC005978]|uniref:DUF202 domain-containing protein n=1 Tax=unclassified Nocardia TaxID=2637762 RepID=UPI0033BAEF1D